MVAHKILPVVGMTNTSVHFILRDTADRLGEKVNA
jgi:hypothetical protein